MYLHHWLSLGLQGFCCNLKIPRHFLLSKQRIHMHARYGTICWRWNHFNDCKNGNGMADLCVDGMISLPSVPESMPQKCMQWKLGPVMIDTPPWRIDKDIIVHPMVRPGIVVRMSKLVLLMTTRWRSPELHELVSPKLWNLWMMADCCDVITEPVLQEDNSLLCSQASVQHK